MSKSNNKLVLPLTLELLEIVENYLHTDEKMNSSDLVDELYLKVQKYMATENLKK
jgi:hypothetical protein